MPDVRANDDLSGSRRSARSAASCRRRACATSHTALAYVVAIADLELAPAESEFLADLAVALGVSDARADELAAVCAQAITPGA